MQVTTYRSLVNRKLGIPCLTDDVKGLDKCGSKVCENLADIAAYAGAANVPDDCIKKVTTGQLCDKRISLQLHCTRLIGLKDTCFAS